LTFPAGAVPQTTQFTVTSTSSYPAAATLVTGTVYEVGPTGFNFAQPVSIRIRYSGTPLPTGVRKTELGLYKVTSGTWQLNPSQSIDSAANTLTASITSLSVFGILGAPAASLVITPPSLSLPVGGQAALSASVKDAA